MIRITEHRFYRKINRTGDFSYDRQEIKRVIVWLIFLPIFIKDTIVSGKVEL